MLELYPEHEKLKLIHNESQAIGLFLEYLGEKNLAVCEYKDPDASVWDGPEGYWPVREDRETLLAEYFDIDRTILESEKLAMLESIGSTL